MSPAERVYTNLVKNHGEPMARSILRRLQRGDTLASIGEVAGVSRERARQWAMALGVEVRYYQLHPEVEKMLLGGGKPGGGSKP